MSGQSDGPVQRVKNNYDCKVASRYSGADAEKLGMARESLARFNTCSCHPIEYGLKKALRRARRRNDKALIKKELSMNEL